MINMQLIFAPPILRTRLISVPLLYNTEAMYVRWDFIVEIGVS